MKKVVFIGILMIIFLGCSTTEEITAEIPVVEDSVIEEHVMEPIEKEHVEEVPEVQQDLNDWRNIELKDISTRETYRISDFAGQKILLESFAVWCPKCTKEQKEIKILKQGTDGVVYISLDTDPNEDEQRVEDHIKSNNFDWYLSVSPIEMTKLLIEEFGVGVVSAPSVPVIVICEDQSATLLPGGNKGKEKLKLALEETCA